jgi:membrane fusion protein (multidrug efflux system)
MLKADQIERPNDPSEQPQSDTVRHSKSPVDRVPELSPDRRMTPPIAPITAKQPDATGAGAGQWSSSHRRQLIRWMMFALLPIAATVAAYWYVAGGKVMSTDDAYVEADTVGISTDVSGIVKQVDVINNQHVEPGQSLYRLDPKQFQIALDNAKANLAQTGLTIDAMKQDYQRMLSDAAAQQGQVALDQTTYDRNAALLPSGSTSKATYDQARYTLDTDKNKLESLRQQAQVQLARLAGNPDIPVTQHPQYLQARHRSTRPSASSITLLSGHRLPAS